MIHVLIRLRPCNLGAVSYDSRPPECSADGDNVVSMIHVLLTVEPMSPTWEQCRWQQRDFDGPPVVSYDSRPLECSADGDNVVSMIHVLLTGCLSCRMTVALFSAVPIETTWFR